MDDLARPAEPETRKAAPFARDAGLTMIAQIVVAVATYGQYWVVRKFWPEADFAAYSQMFRVRNVVEWIVLLVLPVALVREVAAARTTPDELKSREYTWTGLTIGAVMVLLFYFVAGISPSESALALFGNRSMAEWVGPFCNLLAGYSFALMSMSLLRGSMLYRPANLLLIAYSGLLPVCTAYALKSSPLTRVVSTTGAMAALAGLGFLIVRIALEPNTGRPIWSGWKKHLEAGRELLLYGAPRLLTLACVALFTLTLPWFVSHRNNMPLLGGVNIVMLVLGASAILVSGMGFVLLPHLSALLAKGHTQQAGRQLSLIVEFTFFIGGGAALLSTGLLEPFLRIWQGPIISGFPLLIAASCVTIPPLLVLEIMRNPIDAASKAPWNAITYALGALTTIGVTLALWSAGLPIESVVSWSLTTGYYVAALVAMILAFRFYRLQLQRGLLVLPFVAILTAIGLLLERSHLSEPTPVLLSLASCLTYCGLSLALNPRWLRVLVRS